MVVVVVVAEVSDVITVSGCSLIGSNVDFFGITSSFLVLIVRKAKFVHCCCASLYLDDASITL